MSTINGYVIFSASGAGAGDWVTLNPATRPPFTFLVTKDTADEVRLEIELIKGSSVIGTIANWDGAETSGVAILDGPIARIRAFKTGANGAAVVHGYSGH